MRRLLACVAASALALGMAGCSSNGSDKPEDKKTTPETTSTTTQAAENTEDKVLNLYSSRHYDTDTVLLDKFTKETGIKVNVVEAKGPQIIERLINEKDAPAADVLVTVGAESIHQLKEKDILADYNSDVIKANVPEQYRDDKWAAIAYRARVIAYVKGQVDPSTIKSYDDLTKPEWKGQVLARPSKSSYNQALLASFVKLNGEEKAKEWAKGVVDNFGRDPKGNDRDQAKAIVAGEGKLAIMNSYYWVKMNKSSDPAEKAVSEKVDLIFPENTHVNLSYAAVINKAKHPENAKKFIEFLTSPEAQKIIAEQNGEFPVNPKTEVPEPQKSWLGFTPQKLEFDKLGESLPAATKIFSEVGWK